MELLQHAPDVVVQRAVEEVEMASSAVEGLIEVGVALGMTREAAGCVVLQGLVGNIGDGGADKAHTAAAVVGGESFLLLQSCHQYQELYTHTHIYRHCVWS